MHHYDEEDELNLMEPRMAVKNRRRWQIEAIIARPFHAPHLLAMAAFHSEQGWLQPLLRPLVLPRRRMQQKDLPLLAFMVGRGCAKRRERWILER